MKDHESIEIAKQIYRNHKEALDFIFQHAQDDMQDVTSLVSKTVKEKGYILGTINKNKVRFLTEKLDAVIPREGTGWRQKESFLIEFIINETQIEFKAAISPGNEAFRKVLESALDRVPNLQKGNGQVWIIYKIVNYKFKATEKDLDDIEIVELIEKLLNKHEGTITKMEEEILKVRDQFLI